MEVRPSASPRVVGVCPGEDLRNREQRQVGHTPDPAVLDQQLTERQTSGKTAVSSDERRRHSQPGFTRRIKDWTGVGIGPLSRSTVMGIGPHQDLFLGKGRVVKKAVFAGQKVE